MSQYMTILKCSMSRAVNGSLLDPILKAMRSASGRTDDIEFDDALFHIMEKCLSLLPSNRPTPLEIFTRTRQPKASDPSYFESIECLSERISSNSSKDWILREMRVEDALFLWKLCGSSAELILIRNNVITLRHRVLTNPSIVVEDLRMFGNDDGRKFYVKSGVVMLPDKNIREACLSLFLVCLRLPTHPYQLLS